MRKLGILTYYWPPAGGPGVQRWLKLSKYLAAQGVEVHIVCPHPESATYPLRDTSLIVESGPFLKVHTTATSEKFAAYKKLTRKKEVPFSGFSGEDEQVNFVQKVARFVRGNFLVPDARKGWNKHAFKKAAAVVEQYGVHHWITTSPPHSTQLVGERLKREFGIHWTADFRDPWTDIYYYRKFYPLAITRWYESRLERRIFAGCDRLISVSPAWKDLYIQKGAQPASKAHTITNGFDPEDFEGLVAQRPDRLTLTYAGTLAAQYPVDTLVEVLNALALPIHLRIIGTWDGQSEKALQKLHPPMSLSMEAYMPKAALNQELRNSHLMLFLLPNVASATGHIPGKLFDYLGSGNPIFGLGPSKGDAATIIQEHQAGAVFEYSDVEGMTHFLRTAVEQGVQPLRPELVASFSREQQAKQVAQVVFGDLS